MMSRRAWWSVLLAACACSDAERPAGEDGTAGGGVAAPVPAPAASVARPAEERWRAIEQRIEAEFEDVEEVAVAQLRHELLDPTRTQPRIVDVRAAEEFAVSCVPGAENVPWGEGFVQAFGGEDPRREIVVYCSVGYRSALAARALQEAGFSKVRNLAGSIFEWANRGLPLVTPGGEPASVVHPFDADWGELLRADLRAGLR